MSLADEIVMIAEHAGAWDEVANGLAVRYEIHLTRGEVHDAQGDLERHIALAEELKLRSQSWHTAAHQAELLLLLGRFAEAAACIDQALRRGAAAHWGEAMRTAAQQRLLLFLEQGGFEGVGLKTFGRRWNAWKPIVHRTGSVQPFSPGSIVNLGTSEKRRQGSTC